jgi:hypothetical protein
MWVQGGVTADGDVMFLRENYFRWRYNVYGSPGVRVIHFYTSSFTPYLLCATLYSVSFPVRTLLAISAFIL